MDQELCEKKKKKKNLERLSIGFIGIFVKVK